MYKKLLDSIRFLEQKMNADAVKQVKGLYIQYNCAAIYSISLFLVSGRDISKMDNHEEFGNIFMAMIVREL
jgi:hypothetical protein